MNLLLVPSGETVPDGGAEAMRGVDALAVDAEALPPRAPGLSLHARVDAWSTGDEAHACRSRSNEPSRADGRLVACANDPAGEAALDERVEQAARKPVDGVLLERPDAWYAGEDAAGTGHCAACDARLGEHLQIAYGESFVPFDMHEARAQPEPPFVREWESVRLRAAVEHGGRLARRARDEARRVRGSETAVGASFQSANPAAVLLAQDLDYVVTPAPEPVPDGARVAPYELFRAALGTRPLVGLLPERLAARPGHVLQAARLAAASGAEIALPRNAPDASHAALAAHRQFWKEFRSRYRPVERLAEVLLVYSPECDHHSGGEHGAGVRAAAEALTALGAQYRVVMRVPRAGSEPLVLADATALPEADAARLERRVSEGASAIVIGACGAVDDDGRALEGPFPALDRGLNRVGSGTVFSLDNGLQPVGGGERRWESLMPTLDKALESLLGRGRRAASCSRPSVVVKLYVDPDRKLDVHLVGRQFDPHTGAPEPVHGALLHLAGFAVSSARSGYLFTADGPERKVTLTPFGMGVQVTLPDFAGAAILTVAR